MPSSLSASAGLLTAWLAPFACLFTRSTWGHVPVLVEGTLLTLHRRTVSAALRATGRDSAPGFARYHRVLNRALSRWSARAAAGVLLGLLVAAFAPSGPVVIGVDDTLERRWGKHTAGRGIYRDAVRSKGFEIMRMIRRGHCMLREAGAAGEVRFVNKLFGLPA